MAYLWDSSLETGYEKVDNQHRQLVAALNDLSEANSSGKGDKAVIQTLEFLTSYTVKHFADEEKLQKDFNYPDYLFHKRIHDDFKMTVKEMTERIIRAGPSEALVNEVITQLGDWLLNHIKGDDFRMAAFVKVADVSHSSG